MSFAEPADLATYLQRDSFDGDADGSESAQLALDIASAIVRDRAGQAFTKTVDDVIVLDGYGEDLYLPQRPVQSVTSVTTRDRGSLTTVTAALNGDYEVRGHRLRWVGIGAWPHEATVTYTHGYDEIPDDVKGATLAVAAELYSNPEGLSASAIDDSNDRHEWAEDSPAERMLKLVERRYSRRPLTVRMR